MKKPANELKAGDRIGLLQDGAFITGAPRWCQVLDCQYCGFGVQRIVLKSPDGVLAVLVACHWIVEVKDADRAG